MKRFIVVFMLILIVPSVYGQAAKANISEKKGAELNRSLVNAKTDSVRLIIALRLAAYHILKGNTKQELDSGDFFIKLAGKLSERVGKGRYDGYLLLAKCCIAKSNGHPEQGRAIFPKAVQLLKNTHDSLALTAAYLQLFNFYHANDPLMTAQISIMVNEMLPELLQIKSHEDWDFCIRAIVGFYQINLYYSDNATKLDFLGRLSHICGQLNDQKTAMWAREGIAEIHLWQGKTLVAEKELLQILKIQKALKSTYIYYDYDELSLVYIYEENYAKSLYYALEAVKSVKSPSDSTQLPGIYARVAYIYDANDNPVQNMVWEKKGLDYKIAKRQTAVVYPGVLAIAGDLLEVGRPKEALSFTLDAIKKYPPVSTLEKRYAALALGETYEALDEKIPAEKYFLETVRPDGTLIDKAAISLEVRADKDIADFFLQQKQYTRAGKYFQRVLTELAPGAKNYKVYYKNDFMFKLDSASGNYLSAVKDLQRSQRLKDSIFNTSKSKQLAELQITYETKAREKDFNLLSEKEKLALIKLKHTELARNWIIAGSIMLLIIAGLLYSQNKQRNKNNLVITHKNDLLQRLVKEKEWLLKEVHHRVKNNLHTVICLLESQAAYLESNALKAIENSQHRIYAMSLIHQKLYQSDDVKAINMAAYISELVQYLEDSFGMSDRIYFVLNVDSIKLDIGYAIPLGLIINEAVTNAFKYAFPGAKNGRISISIKEKDGIVELEIADNGVGMPEMADENEPESLGIELMKGLSGDIDANITFDVKNGTRISIIFEPHESINTDTYLSKFKTKEMYL